MKSRKLIVLGCSERKLQTDGPCPAAFVYDGPMYRVLRRHLRSNHWQENISIAVLSARYGLIGALTPITTYNERLTFSRAEKLAPEVNKTLEKWSKNHDELILFLGKDYLACINQEYLCAKGVSISHIPGPIGRQLQRFRLLLADHATPRRTVSSPANSKRPSYFLPDWDDFLDCDYNFKMDFFSAKDRSNRNEVHCVDLMKPKRICDGVLVSLAQLDGGKGLLRNFGSDSERSLAPKNMHSAFGLSDSEWAFGDCGAFSYINFYNPPISPKSAAALYEAYGFDLGASVDHIPVTEIKVDGKQKQLPTKERRRRALLTRDNASYFLDETRHRKYAFTPIGIIQALSPRDYARRLNEYVEMGYKTIALGGLVPRKDKEIAEIVQAIQKAYRSMDSETRSNLWIHLFGIFRPKIQELIHADPVKSFDSATYFRKAWLRSGQNYLGSDSNWYAAIRVPMMSDPRTRKKVLKEGHEEDVAYAAEAQAMHALQEFSRGNCTAEMALRYVMEWDGKLQRGQATDLGLWKAYQRTLESRIWEECDCPVCREIGIEVVIFRGYNRNKRRGAHNTYRLYEMLKERPPSNISVAVDPGLV